MKSHRRNNRSLLGYFVSSSLKKLEGDDNVYPQSPDSVPVPTAPPRTPLAPLTFQSLPSTSGDMTSIASPTSGLPNSDPGSVTKTWASRRSSRSSDIQDALNAAASQSSSRRKSQSHLASPARVVPYPPSKPSRRPSHTHSQSTSSVNPTDRRGSLPTLHFKSSSVHANDPVSSIPAYTQDSLGNINSDYSSLSSFTFGAATSSVPRVDYSTEHLSPLAPSPSLNEGSLRKSSTDDRTPRPSISHPYNGADHDEAARHNRAKMRAIDYGSRRPSLPTNLDSIADPETSCTPNPSSTDLSSENQERTSLSDVEFDANALDTDVEYDGELDTSSIHTFGDSERMRPRSTSDNREGFADSDPDSADDDWQPTRSERMPVDPSSTSLAPNDGVVENRAREGSAATIRMLGQNVDDRLRSLTLDAHARPLPATPISPVREAAAWEGLDTDYIFSGVTKPYPASRRSSLSFVQPLAPPPSKQSKDKGKSKSKGKGRSHDILAGATASNYAIAPWALDDSSYTRRASAATISGDDTFARQLRYHDQGYVHRRQKWSFIRQSNYVVGLHPPHAGSSRRVKAQSTWKCDQVGLLKAERMAVLSSDPSRRPQQRMNVMHVVDSSNPMGNTGGPGCLIHKHSRAKAFAIYRYYGVLDRRPPRGSRMSSVSGPSLKSDTLSGTESSTSLPSAKSVLLAPKAVQTQFTNTHSTRNLEDHGLLGGNQKASTRAQRRGLSERPARDTRLPRHIIDPRELPDIIDRPSTAGTSRSSTAGTSMTSPLTFASTNAPSISSSTEPLVRQRAFESSEGSEYTADTTSTEDSHNTTSSDYASHDIVETLVDSNSAVGDADGDEDEETSSDRKRYAAHTSHAEAFSTLDQITLDQLRARNQDSPRGSWLQRVRSQWTSLRPQPGAIQPIHPPWVTLAPRTQQEEQADAIKTLNNSFVDVGLLPSQRKKGGNTGRSTKGKHEDALSNVPDDALCMLLPLWPKETDPVSAAQDPLIESFEEPALEDRLYLLVYFVKFEEKRKVDKDRNKSSEIAGQSKKRPRSSHQDDADTQATTVIFDCFRVTARLMSYDDLKGSNVRLPLYGLSVTGPVNEAVAGIPKNSLRDAHQDDPVIAMCANREAGNIEFLPDGLEKVGMCVPRKDAMRVAAGMQVVEEPDGDDPQPLTAIGRAAVEMVWLACMALTNFVDS